MSEAARIAWWLEQVEATHSAVSLSRENRRYPRCGSLEDEERIKRGSAAPMPAPSPRPRPSAGDRSIAAEGAGSSSSGRGALQRARQLAAGYQPAVIKVVSYARGVQRATATGHYVQREEVALETHDGRMLEDRQAVAEEIKAWSARFDTRAESRDVMAMRIKLHGVADTHEGRSTYDTAIAAGLAGHRFAYRLESSAAGELEAQVVVAMAGSPKERFRIQDVRIGQAEGGMNQRRLDARSEAAVKGRMEAVIHYPVHAMSLEPGASSHGREGVVYRLNRLVERGPATDDQDKPLSNVADVAVAAREWNRTLRSQSSRDTMHLIISAKADTDADALKSAARAFLHDRFGDHKFMFGIHTDKQDQGHIHAHAIITVRSESGQKLHPGRETFRDWRAAYAEHAQAQGLKIVATSARERASSQSYGPKDKAIVETADRPRPQREARDRAYAADPVNRRLIENARHRIATAHSNPIRLPMHEPSRTALRESAEAWRAIAREDPADRLATTMTERLSFAQTVGVIIQRIGTRVEQLSRGEFVMAITADKMVKDLKLMNEAVSKTSDLLDGETRKQFVAASGRYLETLANRIDLQRALESGAQTMTRAEIERIAGPNADRLIAEAQAISTREAQEARIAERLADRAVEAERRDEPSVRMDPQSQIQLVVDRASVAGTEQLAARAGREAAAAAEAARQVVDHPVRPIPEALLQSDALAKLRAEQERLAEQFEQERIRTESLKGQKIK